MNVRLLAPLVAGLLCATSLAYYAWVTIGPSAWAPRFECDPALVHLGTVLIGEERRHEFRIRNSGGEPLNIQATVGCATCMRLPAPTLAIPPGSEATLPVLVDSTGATVGDRVYRVLLETNDPAHAQVILQLQGSLAASK